MSRNLSVSFSTVSDGYLAATHSHALPNLDPALVVRCMAEPSQTKALRALREALVAERPSSTG
jgi:hypothetical protein